MTVTSDIQEVLSALLYLASCAALCHSLEGNGLFLSTNGQCQELKKKFRCVVS